MQKRKKMRALAPEESFAITRQLFIKWLLVSIPDKARKRGSPVTQLIKRLARSVAVALLLVLVHSAASSEVWPGQAAQEKPVANPGGVNPANIREGASLFRANCSPCHGLNAKGGGRGPDLTWGRWTHGSSDADIFRTISQGVPGTQMPANSFEESEIWAIISYLRSLVPHEHAQPTGDPARGERLFYGAAACTTCHMVKGRGGLLGPDLTRVGASRSTSYLIESIREPDKELSDGMLDPNNHYGSPLVYDTVTVVMKNGQKVTGIAKNEDTFSVQLLDTSQNLRLFLKSDVNEVVHERKSLMPSYPEQIISNVELQDLLAYLESLRGE
jgi:cytochrome c oxidase cbb3-type subunit 3